MYKCRVLLVGTWEKENLLYSFSIFPDLPHPHLKTKKNIFYDFFFFFLNIEIPICGELLQGLGATRTSALSLTGTAVNEPGEKMWVAS